MILKAWQRLVRDLVSDPSQWGFSGAFAYRKDFDHVVTGVIARSSSLDKKFDIYSVVLPLAPPSSVVNGTWSQLLNARQLLGPGLEDVPALILPVVSSAVPERAHLQSVIDKAHSLPTDAVLEAAAYACILVGDFGSAQEMLERVLASPVDDRAFVLRQQARVMAVWRGLSSGGVADVDALIRGYEEETVSSLRLERNA